MRLVKMDGMRAAFAILAIVALTWTVGHFAWAQGSAQSQANPPNGRTQQERNYTEPVYFAPDAGLRWPLTPETKPYGSIDGTHLREYIKELIDISHRSRDRGDQLWGRITGQPADAETAQWFMDKLKQAGVTDIHQEQLDLPPQAVTKSWNVTVEGNGKTMTLESALPGRGSPGTNGAVADAEAIYVGLGTASDFMGRDVKGKAVFIYSQPLPGAWTSSGSRYDAITRAENGGAAVVFISIQIPGNFKEAVGSSTKEPGFTLGMKDGLAVREMMEASNGRPVHVKFSSDIQMVSGEKTSLVWGVIPGMTDEKIVINAHRDGYFEAADDNGSGVANALGLAEYFAKMPKEKRKRTIIIIGNPGHHNTPVGSQYMVAHKDVFFSKAALLINCEHTAQAGADLYGFKLMMTNSPWDQNWFVGGGPKLAPVVEKDLDAFGVVRYAEMDPSPPGDIGMTYKLAPSLQLIQQSPFYHSDHDTLDTISTGALENVTRAYAKIIDDVNKMNLSDLVLPQDAGSEGR